MRHAMTLTAALAAMTLTIGCGDSGGGSSSTGAPSAEQAQAVQLSDGASDASGQTMHAANDAILNAGSGGAVAAKGEPGAGLATGSFSFQANLNFTLDLDETDGAGADRFPNATGQLKIVASGSVSGSGGAGSADYAVETTWLTEGVFTDPVSGCVAKMASGSGLSYSLHVEWNYVDELNWSINAESDLSGNHSVTVIDGAETFTATATGSRHVEASIARTPSSFTVVYSVTGTRTVTLSNGTETHVVVVNVNGLDKITITVDGVVYGPYTAVQIRRFFNCHID
jgi:hypothetical protein